jgi:hypothetical protein
VQIVCRCGQEIYRHLSPHPALCTIPIKAAVVAMGGKKQQYYPGEGLKAAVKENYQCHTPGIEATGRCCH